jgi:hypothetical protein
VTNEVIEVSLDGLIRLQSAVSEFARAELARIAGAVIHDLRSRPAEGTFDEVKARHLWDEYCWALQEGPFDDDMGWDDLRLGSLTGAFDDLARASIAGAVEGLPPYAKVFLSGLAFDEDEDPDQNESLGCIWIDGIANLILRQVNEQAGQRNLDLLGPHRGDVIGYEISGSGTVWSALSDMGEATDLIASHVNAMIDPDGDLAELADAMVDAYLATAEQEAEGAAADLLRHFDNQLRSLVLENDVLPSLRAIRTALLERLDP